MAHALASNRYRGGLLLRHRRAVQPPAEDSQLVGSQVARRPGGVGVVSSGALQSQRPPGRGSRPPAAQQQRLRGMSCRIGRAELGAAPLGAVQVRLSPTPARGQPAEPPSPGDCPTAGMLPWAAPPFCCAASGAGSCTGSGSPWTCSCVSCSITISSSAPDFSSGKLSSVIDYQS